MTNIREFTIFSLVTFMVFIITGCGDTNSDSSTSNLKTYNITLSGESEVPSVTTSAKGSGTLTLNTDSNVVTGSFSFSGMTATAAHIHSGFTGSNGEVLFALELSSDLTKFSVPSNTVLDTTDLASLKNGKLYVNIHSTTFPSGELRGQVVPSDVMVYKVALSGGQEVPAVSTTATGTAYLTVNKTSGKIYGTVKTSGMAPTASHIHTGASGTNGDVLFGLEVDSTDANNFSVPESTVLDAAALASLTNKELYVNVHSATFPSGELRGQVVSNPEDETTTAPVVAEDETTTPIVVEDNTAAIASGKTKYDSTCVVCHSEDGSGGIGPDLRLLSMDFIKNKLMVSKASGTGTMGNVAKNLSDEEIENLSFFAETL
jgi:cytochrome c553